MESTANNAPAASGRLQFSLRSLLVVMVLCGLLLGRYGIRRYELSREEAALAELQAHGADVQFHQAHAVGVSFSGSAPPVKTLELLQRVPRLQRLVLIDTDVSDAGLAAIGELQGLEQLLLLGADITDDGLAHVARLANLRILRLDNTQISDEGLKHLARLQYLERLDLVGTRVTDNGLQQLTRLRRLQRLYLNDTAVTEAGASWLVERLPEARIVR
jgi:hypothetical protein